MERPYGDQILVHHASHVSEPERHECLGPSGRGDELNLKTIGLIRLHHGPEISVPKATLRHVAIRTTTSSCLNFMLITLGMLSRTAEQFRPSAQPSRSRPAWFASKIRRRRGERLRRELALMTAGDRS